MILRRLIEHVRTQNWFAVSLDFLIVVFGVFIGLQVNNWNEARLENQFEKVALEGLVQDHQKMLEQVDDFIDLFSEVLQANSRMIALIETQKLQIEDPEAIQRDLSKIFDGMAPPSSP